MKSLQEFLLEAENNNEVYVLYMDDNTMVNFYMTKAEAEQEKQKLEKENKDNKCTIKKEKRSTVEK